MPFVLCMAIQERRTKGKYTGFHWRKQFRTYVKTKEGKKWLKQCHKVDKDYVKIMLKEIKNEQ